MRIFEIARGWQIPISNEEFALLKRVSELGIPKKQLSEREVILANQLVIKDLLSRNNLDGEIHYKRQPGTRKI